MYSVVNIEKLKLYEPPLITDTKDFGRVTIMDKFSPEYLDKRHEDIILDKRNKTA